MIQSLINKEFCIVTAVFVTFAAFVSGPGFYAHAAPKAAAKSATPQKAAFKRGSYPKCFGYQGDRVACMAELNQIIDAGDFREPDLDGLWLMPGEVSEKILTAVMTVKASDVAAKNKKVGDLIISSDFSLFSKTALDRVTEYLLTETCSERPRAFGYHLYYVSGAAPLTSDSMKKLAEMINEECQRDDKYDSRFEPISGFLFESSESVNEPMRSQIIRYYSTHESVGGLPGESIDGRPTIIEYDYNRDRYLHADRPVSLTAVTRMNQLGSTLNDQEFSELLATEVNLTYTLDKAIEDRSIHTEVLKSALNTYDRAVIAREVMGRKYKTNLRYGSGGGLVAGTGLTGASTLTKEKSFMVYLFALAARRAKLFRVHQMSPVDANRFASYIKAEVVRRVQLFAERIKADQVATFFEDDLIQLIVDMRILRNMAPKAEDIRSFANLLAQSKQTPYQGSDIGLVVALVGLQDSAMTLDQKFHVVRYIDGWKLGNKIDAYVYSLFLLSDGEPMSPLFQTQFNKVNAADGFAMYRLFDALELFFGTMGSNEKVWSGRYQRDKRNEWYRAKVDALKAKGYVMPDIEMVK